MKKFTKTITFAVFAAILLCSALAGVSCTNPKPPQAPENYSLINPDATEEAVALYSYLNDNYGKKMFTGQYINIYEDYSQQKYLTDKEDKTSFSVFKANELKAIYDKTGQYPAILGLDLVLFMLEADKYTLDLAKQWNDNGGIVTFCWHWLAPGREGANASFYTDQTDFNLKTALADKNGADYKAIIEDIDQIAEPLKILQSYNIPVLWRPLHEASGGWFWWGASGADCYKELWNILYDRLVNYHKINNLIWIWNGQNTKWYVGDDKCDMLGNDPYAKNRFSYSLDKARKSAFNSTTKASSNKIVAMTETDFIPDINECFASNSTWLFYAVWFGEYVCGGDATNGFNDIYSENYSTTAELTKTYADERTVKLNDVDKTFGGRLQR